MDELHAKLGARSTMIELLQRKLRYLGYYRGSCDGLYDLELDNALRKFRKRNKLKHADGCDQATFMRVSAAAGMTFPEVLDDELEGLRAVPKRVSSAHNPGPPLEQQVTAAAHASALAGLALSGGGVRSATFSLGILQALAQTRLLHHFDYLSTVSGGGYIGAWLSKWIARTEEGVAGVESALAKTQGQTKARREPAQVTFLRQYSNYLTPKTGLFSADTWTFIANYIRNTFLNFLILGAVIAALLCLPRILVVATGTIHPLWYVVLASAAFLYVVHYIAFAVSLRPTRNGRDVQGQKWVLRHIVMPLVLAAVAGSCAFWAYYMELACVWGGMDPRCSNFRSRFSATLWQTLILTIPGLVYFVVWASGLLRARAANEHRDETHPRDATIPFSSHGLGHLAGAITALAVGTALVLTLPHLFLDRLPLVLARPWDIAIVAPSLVDVISYVPALLLCIFGVSIIIMIGLIGRAYSDRTREWWSRLVAWTIICTTGWTALTLLSMYSPVVMSWLHANSAGLASALLASGWVGTAWSMVYAAQRPARGRTHPRRLSRGAISFIPPILATVLCAGVASVLFAALAGWGMHGASWNETLNWHHARSIEMPLGKLVMALLICTLVAVVFANRVDVNKFSLYMMYRNRLVRAYLGAVDAGRRMPDPFTGFDSDDDISLADVGGTPKKAQRPYLIVNAALNLVRGKELAWQTRKAANFTFTPRYCGFETPSMPVSGTAATADASRRGGFRPTHQYGAMSRDADEVDRGAKLGMAMAISGAAVGSSMGFYSSVTLAFVMTLLNARLGRWCGNPASNGNSWKKDSPPAGLGYLLMELFGQTDATAPYLYLSDGGHFENLGIYELVRRRCRLIVAVDASADSERNFADLGNAVRKCYTDFNVEIDVNVREMELASSGYSTAYFVVGKIRYSATDPQQPGGVPVPDGTLLYIKPSLCGTEYVSIANYQRCHPTFPHQGTSDQWFDEPQFESYRSLGEHIGNAVFRGLPVNDAADGNNASAVEKLCAAIERRARAKQEPTSELRMDALHGRVPHFYWSTPDPAP